MFGKKLSEYVNFVSGVLLLIAAVALLRLGLSLGGVPHATVKWVSPTIVTLLAVVYYAVRVHRTSFGSYRQLYPLGLFASLTLQTIVALGIVIAILSGQDNIYTIPEMSGGQDGKTWFHAFAHLVLVGALIGPLVNWAIASLTLLIARKAAPNAR
jgi:hypothetical protein